jgi:hypothetical protein
MAAKKAKKSLACPSYTDPYTPPKPKLEELASVLLRKSVRQTALLSKILSKLKVIRALLSFCVYILL